MDLENAEQVLEDVSMAVGLEEGPEGIRKILRFVCRFEPVPLHALARAVMIPVPVASAARRELEKRDICSRKSGIILTQKGKVLLQSIGINSSKLPELKLDYPVPESLGSVAKQFESIQERRPAPNFALDQSHVDSETSALRSAYLYEHDALDGRDLIFIGDDDLTSLAVCLLSSEYDLNLGTITVIDVDTRILRFISTSARSIGVDINTIECDLRQGLPGSLVGCYDVFFTDPPYTINGLRLFASCGVQALRPISGRPVFLSFGAKSPNETWEAYKVISDNGLAVQEVVPAFNRYVGNQIHAGASNMIRCSTTNTFKPAPPSEMEFIYTASQKKGTH
ncbi:MAG: bis-aminopropyl spermidine synthase family protein [Chloroflexota bacterium]|nr:bis-aminopropyl spermidine synthase family protein [Chloroflexota bacterium]